VYKRATSYSCASTAHALQRGIATAHDDIAGQDQICLLGIDASLIQQFRARGHTHERKHRADMQKYRLHRARKGCQLPGKKLPA